MNDRQILARLEAATPEELRSLLRRPSRDEDRVLRTYFGTARYEALRKKALATRRARAAAGNVVVLHGIMGGELNVRQGSKDQRIWIHPLRLALGAVGWMRMDAKGKSVFDVGATGILKKWYADLLLSLSAEWNVQAYWYDWRCNLDDLADDVRRKIDGWFGDKAPVHLVGHSMGGLVSRTYIQRHGDRWKKGGQLLMLGTPNHGSFAIPQVITGCMDMIRWLARIDIKHNLEELTAVLGSLPGSLQMLPSPLVMPGMAALYQGSTWRGRVPQGLLDAARRHHDMLAETVDGQRMRYIAGCNRRTYDDVRDWTQLDSLNGYTTSMNGDGTVPHRLGLLEEKGERIPTFFIQEDHGALPTNEHVIGAVHDLLREDRCDLSRTIQNARSVAGDRRAAAAAAVQEQAQRQADAVMIEEFAAKAAVRTRGGAALETTPLSADEVQAETILVRAFLAESDAAAPTVAASPKPARTAPRKPPAIEIGLVLGGIEKLRQYASPVPAVDAIAVGHYQGVAPQNAELELDRAISGWRKGEPDSKLMLTALHRRNAIGGAHGRQFMLPDPRDPRRYIVLAGMGVPGRFREAELTVLVRELTWMMGRLQRRHLETVLIGGGAGNLSTGRAVRGWLRGVRRAFYEMDDVAEQLRRITFVEFSPEQFTRIHDALVRESASLAQDPHEKLIVHYDALPPKRIKEITEDAVQQVCKQASEEFNAERQSGVSNAPDPVPVRLTVHLTQRNYEYAALTEAASVPQRTVTVDPSLIDEINAQIPTADEVVRQRDLGHLLGHLLLPADLREVIADPGVPTVLIVDAQTARVHFETMALSPADGNGDFDPDAFLGTRYGFTRQLRTELAPLPEPPLLSDRPLRVLVVADPAEDAPLPGAQEEGLEVVKIFEEFAVRGGHPVEVVPLLGPAEATRVRVLDQLINHRFDMMHYAGHCFFNDKEPPASGWLFSGGQVLSAYELNRIDRIPRFVFSNACESGITSDPTNKRQALLAPSFAEAFFARGVANFICTAWPIDDLAALTFARRVYRGLLGLDATEGELLHTALREARRLIARTDGGLATWGAYQHYGDPSFSMRAIPRARLHRMPAQRKGRSTKRKRRK